jgi:hypothetical protein
MDHGKRHLLDGPHTHRTERYALARQHRQVFRQPRGIGDIAARVRWRTATNEADGHVPAVHDRGVPHVRGRGGTAGVFLDSACPHPRLEQRIARVALRTPTNSVHCSSRTAQRLRFVEVNLPVLGEPGTGPAKGVFHHPGEPFASPDSEVERITLFFANNCGN